MNHQGETGIDEYISGLGLTLNFTLGNLLVVVSVPEIIDSRLLTQANKAPEKLPYTIRIATYSFMIGRNITIKQIGHLHWPYQYILSLYKKKVKILESLVIENRGWSTGPESKYFSL